MIHNMNKILDGLFLGNIDAANDTSTLLKNGITHVLIAACGLEPANINVIFKFYRGRNLFGKESMFLTCPVLI